MSDRYEDGNDMVTRMIIEAEERPWAAYAACRRADPDLFFPGPDGDVSEALKICAGCPVQEDCLEWALDTRVRYGVWGGTTERERRRLFRRSA
jgi:WhiB family redox-sensing transcriptional regulator